MTNLSKNWNILSDMYICVYIYIYILNLLFSIKEMTKLKYQNNANNFRSSHKKIVIKK